MRFPFASRASTVTTGVRAVREKCRAVRSAGSLAQSGVGGQPVEHGPVRAPDRREALAPGGARGPEQGGQFGVGADRAPGEGGTELLSAPVPACACPAEPEGKTAPAPLVAPGRVVTERGAQFDGAAVPLAASRLRLRLLKADGGLTAKELTAAAFDRATDVANTRYHIRELRRELKDAVTFDGDVIRGADDGYPDAMSALLSGGLRTGRVVGSTTARGEHPKDRPLTPRDLLATVYRHLGVDHKHEFKDRGGRPIPIPGTGEPIRELV